MEAKRGSWGSRFAAPEAGIGCVYHDARLARQRDFAPVRRALRARPPMGLGVRSQSAPLANSGRAQTLYRPVYSYLCGALKMYSRLVSRATIEDLMSVGLVAQKNESVSIFEARSADGTSKNL